VQKNNKLLNKTPLSMEEQQQKGTLRVMLVDARGIFYKIPYSDKSEISIYQPLPLCRSTIQRRTSSFSSPLLLIFFSSCDVFLCGGVDFFPNAQFARFLLFPSWT
jgi:hypothetical protein